MQRFKTLGLALHLDKDNDLSIQYAVSCARHNGAKLYILCTNRESLSDDQKQQVEIALSVKVNYDYQVEYLDGHPVIEIVQYVKKMAIDLLILEPDFQSDLKRFFFGSLTLSLLRKAPCPVWVVKLNIKKDYQRILICVDPITEDDEKTSLNEKLIKVGTSFAKRESAECHLISTWCIDGESTLGSPFLQTSIEEINKLKMEEKIKVARAFEALQADNKGVLSGCQTHLVYGEPVKAISDFVDENNIDLVVMGTLARSGIKGFVIGNTAEAIINQIECSILAVKPDGFISPIE